jgi:hypothetical protein
MLWPNEKIHGRVSGFFIIILTSAIMYLVICYNFQKSNVHQLSW